MKFWFGLGWRQFAMHSLQLCTLRYIIHFLLPVRICVKNRSFCKREARKQSILCALFWIALSWCGTQRFETSFNCCSVYLKDCRYLINGWLRSSSENTVGLPNHGWTCQLLSPSVKLYNHRWHVLLSTASSPFTWKMLLHAPVALLPLSI